jgi:hypothetical protein
MHTVYAEAGFLCLGMRHFAQKTFRCFAAEQRSRTRPLLERSHRGPDAANHGVFQQRSPARGARDVDTQGHLNALRTKLPRAGDNRRRLEAELANELRLETASRRDAEFGSASL